MTMPCKILLVITTCQFLPLVVLMTRMTDAASDSSDYFVSKSASFSHDDEDNEDAVSDSSPHWSLNEKDIFSYCCFSGACILKKYDFGSSQDICIKLTVLKSGREVEYSNKKKTEFFTMWWGFPRLPHIRVISKHARLLNANRHCIINAAVCTISKHASLLNANRHCIINAAVCIISKACKPTECWQALYHKCCCVYNFQGRKKTTECQQALHHIQVTAKCSMQ